MIRLEGVSKIFKGDVTALREVSVELQRGEFVFLVGPSGSGKSTFLRLLNREEVADTGRVMVAGKDIGEMRSWKVPYLRREIGYVFQDYKLLSRKTGYENVAFGLEVSGLAVAINMEIVRRGDYAATKFSEGDEIEIVRAVGGG